MRCLLISLVFVVLAAGCGPNDPPNLCVGAPSWEVDIGPVAQEVCTPCHSELLQGTAREGAPDGLNFDGYPTNAAIRSAFADSLTSGRMPPPADLRFMTTAAERVLTNDWRRCNFPETATAAAGMQ